MSNIEIFRCRNNAAHLSMRTVGTKRDRCEPCMIRAKMVQAVKDLERARKELPEAEAAQIKLAAVLASVAAPVPAPEEPAVTNGAPAA